MVDVDTFLTALYVMVDDFCQSHRPKRQPGPDASLSDSEILTLVIFARWSRFTSERGTSTATPAAASEGHYLTCLIALSSTAPYALARNSSRRQMALHLAEVLEARECPYEALDSSAMLVRDAKRRGAGWLAGHADIGWSNSLGWYEGFRLLASVDPRGVITGFCFSAASSADQQAAETFFAVRARPNPRLLSVGSAARGAYVTRASRVSKTTDGGSIATGRRGLSVHPNATPAKYGLSA